MNGRKLINEKKWINGRKYINEKKWINRRKWIQWLAKKLVIWSIYLINLVFLTKVFEL